MRNISVLKKKKIILLHKCRKYLRIIRLGKTIYAILVPYTLKNNFQYSFYK